MAKEEKKDVKFPEGNDPYAKEVCKPGMELYDTKSPQQVGFGKDDGPKNAPSVQP